MTQQERNALQECGEMPASPPNSLCWNLAKPREECQGQWFRRLQPGRVSTRAPWLKQSKWGRRWGYGEEICLNLAAYNLAHRYATNDIILPWKESWWKFAAGSQLPTGGCHALWLEKYFFHWQILSPDPWFFFFLHFYSSFLNLTFFIRLHRNLSCCICLLCRLAFEGTAFMLLDSMKQSHAGEC